MPNGDQPAEPGQPASPSQPAAFPPTLWTQVLDAMGPDPGKAARALSRLCEAYRIPILNWFRRSGLDPTDAEDQTQHFFLRHFGEGRLHHFERRQARFRSWLVTCLYRQFIDVVRNRDDRVEALDDQNESAPAPAAVNRMDEEIARMVHQRAWEEVQISWEGKQKALFSEISRFLLVDVNSGDYAEPGARLGLGIPRVKRAVLDLRHDYAVAFHGEVRQICLPGDDEAEMRYLLALVPRS